MIQPSLFDVSAVPTVASPLCMFDGCQRHGRALLGPLVRVSEDCESRSIECLTCGCTGVQSDNLKLRRGKQ